MSKNILIRLLLMLTYLYFFSSNLYYNKKHNNFLKKSFPRHICYFPMLYSIFPSYL